MACGRRHRLDMDSWSASRAAVPRRDACSHGGSALTPRGSGATRALWAATAAAVAAAAALLATQTAAQENLAAARQGSQVIKYTSEQGGPWRAANIIDEGTTPGGWASADHSLPQEITVRLPAASRFNTLVFSLNSGAPEGQWAREIAVYAADPFPTMGGWKLVATVELAAKLDDQPFTVPQANGRFVRLLITSTQSPDAPRSSLARFKLFWR